MQFSEAWLRSLVDPDLNTQQLGHLLTMAGLEVEAIEAVAPVFSGVVVAEILKAEKHPNADRLQVCQVATGGDEPLTIVCGAINARAGLKTACALVGATLPGDFAIRQAKVRGVESFGMLCSARELGVADAADGILELPADAPVGADLRDWLDLDDRLITLKLTPNRGDCLSLLGLARETAALTSLPMADIEYAPVPADIADVHPVEISDTSACPAYHGRVIRDIDTSARTPVWMVRRLERSGLRPIHPVVDVTNYVLLELGQPMHAFDLSRLRGPVRARMARAGEAVKLLNEQEVRLDSDELVIADDTGPLALAGIMGGLGSAVGNDSRDLFLEAAHFSPDAIVGRARRHGLSTDSAHRFERGVDPELPRRAIERATRLILEICGGRAGPVVAVGAGAPARADIPFRPARARRILGFDLDDAAMIAMLERLGMVCVADGDAYRVTAPSHRFDLVREIDLIEEIARIHGYDAIPATPLRGAHVMLPVPEGARSPLMLKQAMAARGYQEVVTYSFVPEELDRDFRNEGAVLPLLNPIASQLGVMRGGLIGGLVQTLRHNLNHGQERLKAFEVGRAFLSSEADGQPTRLAVLAYGPVHPEQWGEPARVVDFFDLRADIESLARPRELTLRRAEHPALHPGQSAQVLIDGEPAGWLGALHPRLALKYGLARAPVVAELDLEALVRGHCPRYRALPRFPAVRRDIAMVVDAGTAVGDMLDAVMASKPTFLARISCFDLYQGEGVESGKKSLAFNMLLQHTEKTLTESEIDSTVAEVVALLANKYKATLRN